MTQAGNRLIIERLAEFTRITGAEQGKAFIQEALPRVRNSRLDHRKREAFS